MDEESQEWSAGAELTLEHDELLSETVARHFPGSVVSPERIELGFGQLSMECWVDRASPWGDWWTTSLHFQLSGGALGDLPLFASVSGYERSVDGAIIDGACLWACSFGPVLRAGLANELQANVDRLEVTLAGRRYCAYVNRLDRALLFAAGEPSSRFGAARERYGQGRWLIEQVLESPGLPPPDRTLASLLSVYVGAMNDGRTVEVKLNGRNWDGAGALFSKVAPEPEGGISLLRELAVLVPIREQIGQ